MTFARVKPAGWALNEVLTSSQMNNLDINVSKSLDGDGGGDYSPSSALKVHGKIIGENVASRKFIYPLALGQPMMGSAWAWSGYGYHRWESDVAGDWERPVAFDLNRFVPQNSYLKRVRVYVDPGTTEATKIERMMASVKLIWAETLTVVTAGASYYPSGTGHTAGWIDLCGGAHDGGNDQAVLTDSWRDLGVCPWVVNALVGYTIYNSTDGSSGVVISNTSSTVTATLAGGSGNDWDDGDLYYIDAPMSLLSSETTCTVVEVGHGGGYSSTDLIHAIEVEYVEVDYLKTP